MKMITIIWPALQVLNCAHDFVRVSQKVKAKAAPYNAGRRTMICMPSAIALFVRKKAKPVSCSCHVCPGVVVCGSRSCIVITWAQC